MTPIWLNLGCGSNRLSSPWRNHDVDMDLRLPLPFEASTVQFISAEHCCEHLTSQEAWSFFAQCHRVLQPGGVVRIAIPDLSRMSKHMTQEYAEAVKNGGHGDGSFQSALKACVFEHGHQSVWTSGLLSTFLQAVGFKATVCRVGQSKHPELRGIEGHGRVVGEEIAEVETSVVEGVKP